MSNEITEAYEDLAESEAFRIIKETITDTMTVNEFMEISHRINNEDILNELWSHYEDEILEEYEEENSHYLDYDAVLEMFLSQFEDCQASTVWYTMDRVKAKINDDIMLREDFNNYTDMLCKEDQISTYAYENWDNPF